MANLLSLRATLIKQLRWLLNHLEDPSGAAPHDPSTLKDMIEHVAYEIAVLRAAYRRFGRTSPNDPLASESFLIHARSLRDFFWNEWNPHGKYACNDILAEHYLSTWRGIKNAVPKVFERTKGPMDGQLAHVSTARLRHRAEDLQAEMSELESELKTVWDRFLSKLPTGLRDQFNDSYDREEAQLRFLNP